MTPLHPAPAPAVEHAEPTLTTRHEAPRIEQAEVHARITTGVHGLHGQFEESLAPADEGVWRFAT